MADFIIIMILVILIGAAVAYIIKAKKSGAQCMGCPAAGKCAGKKGVHKQCDCSRHVKKNSDFEQEKIKKY